MEECPENEEREEGNNGFWATRVGLEAGKQGQRIEALT